MDLPVITGTRNPALAQGRAAVDLPKLLLSCCPIGSGPRASEPRSPYKPGEPDSISSIRFTSNESSHVLVGHRALKGVVGAGQVSRQFMSSSTPYGPSVTIRNGLCLPSASATDWAALYLRKAVARAAQLQIARTRSCNFGHRR